MKITIELDKNTIGEIADELRLLADRLGAPLATDNGPRFPPASSPEQLERSFTEILPRTTQELSGQVKTKKSKKQKEPAPVIPPEQQSDDLGFGDFGAQESAEEVAPAKTLDLKKEVIPEFQKFIKAETEKTDYKTASAKCQKILAKYGAKSVHELKTSDYVAVVKELI